MKNKHLEEIKKLISDLVQKKYSILEQDGRSGRLSAKEINFSIFQYNEQLIELPKEAIQFVDSYQIKGEENVWSFDIPLWTKNEGRSDLTLSVLVEEREEEVFLSIEDIHVL